MGDQIMRLLLCALLFTATITANAAVPLVTNTVMVLQPDSVLHQRVPDVAAFTAYIRSIEAAAAAQTVAAKSRVQRGGFLVVALRPGGKSKAWLDFTPALPDELSRKIIAGVEAVPPSNVTGGPVVFALGVSVWGGTLSPRAMPAPAEWKEAAKQAGKPLEIGTLLERLWGK